MYVVKYFLGWLEYEAHLVIHKFKLQIKSQILAIFEPSWSSHWKLEVFNFFVAYFGPKYVKNISSRFLKKYTNWDKLTWQNSAFSWLSFTVLKKCGHAIN